MSEPTPPDGGAQPPAAPAPKPSPPVKDKPSAKVELLDVVEYIHHDPVLRRDHRGAGVVEAIDDNRVTVRPLAHHSVQVDLADVSPLSADDGA